MNQIKVLLDKFKWDKKMEKERPYIRISYRHRGALNDEVNIPITEIEKIEERFIIFTTHRGFEASIPFHRILKIYNNKTQKIYYEKKKRE